MMIEENAGVVEEIKDWLVNMKFIYVGNASEKLPITWDLKNIGDKNEAKSTIRCFVNSW